MKLDVILNDNELSDKKIISLDENLLIPTFKEELKKHVPDYYKKGITVGTNSYDINDDFIQNKTLKYFCIQSKKDPSKLIFPAVYITSAYQAA